MSLKFHTSTEKGRSPLELLQKRIVLFSRLDEQVLKRLPGSHPEAAVIKGWMNLCPLEIACYETALRQRRLREHA
jgi:hypothetical protein